MDFWGIAVGATIASLAWIYQRAWERQDKRVAQYQEILDRLDAFTDGGLDKEGIAASLIKFRRLWLFAPDEVIRATEDVLDVAAGQNLDPLAAGKCVIAMRQDASFFAVLFPRFWRTNLRPEKFIIRTAKSLSPELVQKYGPKQN